MGMLAPIRFQTTIQIWLRHTSNSITSSMKIKFYVKGSFFGMTHLSASAAKPVSAPSCQTQVRNASNAGYQGN